MTVFLFACVCAFVRLGTYLRCSRLDLECGNVGLLEIVGSWHSRDVGRQSSLFPGHIILVG